jgi:hypothetical protein
MSIDEELSQSDNFVRQSEFTLVKQRDDGGTGASELLSSLEL